MGSGFQVVKVVVTLFVLMFGSAAIANECRENEVFLGGDWGQARFTVELAQTRAERNKGLMHREFMPKSAGMLFVYPRPKTVGFWMKNTLIPLDIAFLSRDCTVQKVHANAIPLDETPILGQTNIKLVLEINGGLAEQIGISQGSQMRHPAVGQDVAAWPCE